MTSSGSAPSGDTTLWPPPRQVPDRTHGTLRDVVQAGTLFDVTGAGPAVVLIHGVGLDHRMWDGIAPRLAEDFTVIRYDMLAHGGSAKPPGPLGLRSFVDQLAALQTYFGLDPFALVGFSMGAVVARAYAVQHPEKLARLVLLNGIYQRSTEQRAAVQARYAQAESEGPRAIIDAALARWFTAPFQDRHPEVLAVVRTRLEQNNPRDFLAAYAVFRNAEDPSPEALAALACPTLVATGALDSGSTAAMTEAMGRVIPGARTEILDGLAHMAPVEDPERVATLVRDFLNTGR